MTAVEHLSVKCLHVLNSLLFVLIGRRQQREVGLDLTNLVAPWFSTDLGDRHEKKKDNKTQDGNCLG